MSGPKVVRVVTREERVETCERLLTQLDVAIRALQSDSVRFGDKAGTDLASSTTRREGLQELIRQNNFDLAEQQAQQEIGFMTAKRNEVIERAATAAAVARQQLRHQRHTATTLLKELERRAPDVHADLAVGLRKIADQSKVSNDAESILEKAMMALTHASSNTHLSDEQKDLARSLQNAQETNIRDGGWLTSARQDKRIVDVQHHLAQIEVLKSTEAAATFTARLDLLEHEAEGAVRSMKIDALIIDVATLVESLKRLTDLIDAAKATLAEVQLLGNFTDMTALRAELQSAIANPFEDQLRLLLAEADQVIGRIRANRAATARREAILAGLGSLGYQVNENMATAWVDDGRIVLKKSDADMHGVEIASAPDALRLQVRAVAFSASLTASSNLAAEITWCGDFGKLQMHLKQHSGDLVIEKGLPVGALPLKVVPPTTVLQARKTVYRSSKTHGA